MMNLNKWLIIDYNVVALKEINTSLSKHLRFHTFELLLGLVRDRWVSYCDINNVKSIDNDRNIEFCYSVIDNKPETPGVFGI